MTAQETKTYAPWWRSAPMFVILGVLVVVGAIYTAVQVYEAREQDRRTDGYYCTFEGVGPLDRAPQTGERCIDVKEQGW